MKKLSFHCRQIAKEHCFCKWKKATSARVCLRNSDSSFHERRSPIDCSCPQPSQLLPSAARHIAQSTKRTTPAPAITLLRRNIPPPLPVRPSWAKSDFHALKLRLSVADAIPRIPSLPVLPCSGLLSRFDLPPKNESRTFSQSQITRFFR